MGELADRIADFIVINHVDVARQRGNKRLSLRAGDIHQQMGLQARMPSVCGVLESKNFQSAHGLIQIERTGPHRGSNVVATYLLSEKFNETKGHPRKQINEPLKRPKPLSNCASKYDVSNALVLVSCVKQKQSYPAQAKDLYTSDLFCKGRRLAEKSKVGWFIFSAKYGLLDPESEIEPYEMTLNNMSKTDRITWAGGVLMDLGKHISGVDRVVILAGQKYREFLIPPLLSRNISVDVPLMGLRLGEQLSWLSQ